MNSARSSPATGKQLARGGGAQVLLEPAARNHEVFDVRVDGRELAAVQNQPVIGVVQGHAVGHALEGIPEALVEMLGGPFGDDLLGNVGPGAAIA